MDESALRLVIANFEGSRSSFHWWLEFFTALVVIGVVLEVVFAIWEYHDDLHEFRRGIVHAPDRPSILLLVLGLFGASLVAIGVAGEFWEEVRIEGVETRIRQANDELYLLLSKEAGDAKNSSEDAAAAATVAKNESGAAVQSVTAARTEVIKLRDETDKLNRGLSDANAKLEGVETKRVQLEKSLNNLEVCSSPRVLPTWSISESKTSVDPLRPFAGHEAIIEYLPNDAETR